MKENRKRLSAGYRVEYEVGTILWWNEREIEVVRNDIFSSHHPCLGCVLLHSRACLFAVECRAKKRKDGTGVHFENLRKEERI